jgi:predicted metal-dependent peptidase
MNAAPRNLNADQRIQRAVISLLRTDPFYADYLLRWPRRVVASGTVGVDGRQMYYNPKFIEAQTDAGLKIILKHEVQHVALKHTLREKGYAAAEMMKSERMGEDELRAMMNTAGDLEINSLLVSDPKDAAVFPDHGFLPGRGEHADHPARQNMEVHFDILRSKWSPPPPPPPDNPTPDPEGQDEGEGDDEQDPAGSPQNDPEGEPDKVAGEGSQDAPEGEQDAQNDPQGGKGDGQGDGEGGSGPSLTTDGFGGMGEFMPDPLVNTEAEAEAASQKYDQEFIGAVMAAQQQGKCPGWAAERAEAICAPAKIPWQIVLRRWARKVVRGGESSYSRPSRRTAHRTDIVLPSKRSQSIRRCLFIVDTSGSMSTEAVNAAVPEMLKIMATWKKAELVMVQCDAGVGSESVYKPGTGFRELQAFSRSPQWNGRGGTDMGPAFALIPKYRPEVVVCLTDGYLSWPDQNEAHGLPVAWLMVNESQKPPWGMRIVLEVER